MRSALDELGYVVIKVTDIFDGLSGYIQARQNLSTTSEWIRYTSYINYGNKLRATFKDDSALAVLTIARLARKRSQLMKTGKIGSKYSKIAFVLHQFKRKEEINLLRSLYGHQFFQISVYSRRGARVDFLSRKFANTENSPNNLQYRSFAENIVQVDYNEAKNDHGQKVEKIFHEADFIVNNDVQIPDPSAQINRFCRILFGANNISPTNIEYGMFIAKAAALRTLDLSRQVGAAVFSGDREIISLGSNEVP